MKLGTKIGLGFGLLILIAMILGGIAVWNMKRVGTESDKLANAYAPEVKMANDVERNSLLTMYAMRGYAMSEEEHYLTAAQDQLVEVKQHLEEMKALADRSPDLAKLRTAVPEAQKGVATYEQLAKQTVSVNEVLAKLRAKMDSAAAVYVKACTDFIASQNKTMEMEIHENASVAMLLDRLRKITLVNDIIHIGNDARIGNFKSQAKRDPELLEKAIATLKTIEKLFDDLTAITHKDVNLRQIADRRRAAEQYGGAMAQYLSNWHKREELNKLRTQAGEKVLQSAQTTSMAGIKQTLDIATLANDSLNQASTVMIVGLVIALVIGSLMAYTITRGITRAITRVVEGLSEGAEQVASASSQVSSASQSLAEGASEQADTLMKEANQVVTTANQSMGDLTNSMEEISKASEETSKIIKTIDEITFQTNLLALNAAVEAARAGEAGAGFAVVADEVRNLAMRAADATKNTANLIEGTVKQVKEGGELVSRTNENFGEVTRAAGKVGELVAEIAAASSEQAQGISQVNTAVNEVDKVTQQNAANAEQSASASEEMNAQAEQMKQFVAELVALVGSAQHGKATHGSALKRVKSIQHPVHHHATQSLLYHASNGNGNGNGNGKAKGSARPVMHAGAMKKQSAEEMIPLDSDFEDF